MISVDSDYVAFVPPGSVCQLASIIPRQSDQLKIITKHDILKRSGMSDLQLALAFSMAGTDNINIHIEGMGWFKSLQYVKTHIPKKWTAATFAKKSPFDRLPGLFKYKNSSKETVTALAKEIFDKLRQFGWIKGALEPSSTTPSHTERPTESALFQFAFELDGKHSLVRPVIAELVRNRFEDELGSERSDLIRKQVAMIDSKYLIQKQVQPPVKGN